MPVNIQLLLDSNKPISYFLFIHIEASCILVSPKIVSNTFDISALSAITAHLLTDLNKCGSVR